MEARPDKELAWLHGAIRTPPFGEAARREAGALLRQLQRGELLSMPASRPMPSIGPRVHELRVRDAGHNWRIIYRIDPTAILIADVFAKATPRTPRDRIVAARARLARFDRSPDPE